MARYIDTDVLLTDEMTHTLPNRCGRSSGRVVVFADDIENAPTADVVPKSEVELPPELPTEARNKVNERARKAFQKLYEEALQDAIEHPENYGDIFDGYENNLPTALALINWQKMEIERLTINMNTYGLAVKRTAEQKTEVAREIFEEIERFLYLQFRFCKEELGNDDTEYVKGRLEHNTQMQDLIAELKKKYTEGK